MMTEQDKLTFTGPTDVLCMACTDGSCDFKPMKLQRRALNDVDIKIAMKYCGICHTDLHTAAGHLTALGLTNYPCVPGHELAGVCVEVGSKVTKVKVGDLVGVGCMVDSCRECGNCKAGLEQKCIKQVGTYNAPSTPRAESFPPKTRTLGGYTDVMVVQQDFAIIIPPSYPLECAGPVMCAGVTLYDPLMVHGAGPGTRVAIVGLGGLGIMGVKIAKALGCTVLAVSSSSAKEGLAKQVGADSFVTAGGIAGSAHVGKIDLVLNTVPVEHDYTVYSRLLGGCGKQVILGLNTALVAGIVTDALCCDSRIKGSGIGSIKATQEVIDLCAKHDIRPEIKLISVGEINQAYTELDGCNVSGTRHVIDLSTLSSFEAAEERCRGSQPPTITAYKGMSGMDICGAICAMLCCCRCCC